MANQLLQFVGGLLSGNEPVYAEKLFDNSFVHRIDIRLADADWSGLLSDPISKTKYAADIVIDGETFSNVFCQADEPGNSV